MDDTRFATIVLAGKPNAGKSTLLNRIVGTDLAITSAKPQSTRYPVIGVHTVEDTQIEFVDPPGLLDPGYALQHAMMAQAIAALESADGILYLHPITEGEPPDLASLLPAAYGAEHEFVAADHPGLHPGQSAVIRRQGAELGWIGALHPELARKFELDGPVYLFEIALEAVRKAGLPALAAVSRFPAIHRDLAVVVDEDTPAAALTSLIWSCEPKLLKELRIFDVYRGKGVDSGRKSIALSLILQESSRTLNEDAVDKIMVNISSRLAAELGAQIRE